jgi:hypothetical protein
MRKEDLIDKIKYERAKARAAMKLFQRYADFVNVNQEAGRIIAFNNVLNWLSKKG